MTPGGDQAAARHDRHGFSQGGVRAAVQTESERKVPAVLDDCCAVGQNSEGWKHLGREKHLEYTAPDCLLKFYRANSPIQKEKEGKIYCGSDAHQSRGF